MPRDAEWESRWWSPIINAEHLAMRDRVGMVDLSAFAIFDVTGPGALDYLQRLCVAADGRAGRAGRLHAARSTRAGGIIADLTIMRLGRDRLPGRDRRRAWAWRDKQVVHRSPAGGRLRPALRRDVDAGRRSGSGARARATSSRR